MANTYFLNQIKKGFTVQMYEFEVQAIKKHLQEHEPNMVHRLFIKKQDGSKLVLCRIN